MNPRPPKMTNRTMNTFNATRTRLTRIDSLIPQATSAVSTATRKNAGRSKWLLGTDGRRPRETEVAQQGREVRRPALRDDAGSEHELQEQVPADDPGDELTQRRVREGACGSAHRARRREPGVAEGGERATQRSAACTQTIE